MIKMVDLHKQDGCIRNDIDKAIADAVDECAFIKGAEVGTFEAELAHYVNAKYCISCGNGTDAITLALMAVGLRPGDEVIVPAFSFVAAAEAVAQQNSALSDRGARYSKPVDYYIFSLGRILI